jgi:2'-5' RNA ligase
MRAFIAIYPPPEIRADLLQAARTLLSVDEFRWVKPANVHLTLKFLGDIEEESLADLGDILDTVCGRHGQFDIEPDGIGAFPSTRKARIIWAGVGKGSDALLALSEDLEESLSSFGLEREKRGFEPHITLGRSKGQPGRLPETGAFTAPGFVARRIELVESSLGEGGTCYDTLSEHPLIRAPKRSSD